MSDPAIQSPPPPTGGRDRRQSRQGEGRWGHALPPKALDRARQLRRAATPAEAKLWLLIRAGRIEGVKFKRQVPIGPYIADFCSITHRLVIEIDGSQHAESNDYDARRTTFLAAQGYRVLRFWNIDVLKTPDACVEAIYVALAEPSPPLRFASHPLPPVGGGGTANTTTLPLKGGGTAPKAQGEGSSRLDQTFTRLTNPALIAFITSGDPTPADTPAILTALVEGGADIVELGMPFSDPMADGPAIQAANLRALAAGATMHTTLAAVATFRAAHPQTPLILMGYLNPILAHGAAAFAHDAAQAGADGVIVVDAPPEEDADLAPHLRAHGLHLIRLATPTTNDHRLPTVLAGASGFLYYVAVAGITGAGSASADIIGEAVSRLKRATHLPIAVGFGIRTPEQAAAVARHADAVVVGSAIVDTIAAAHAARANDLATPVRDLVASLAQAVHKARA